MFYYARIVEGPYHPKLTACGWYSKCVWVVVWCGESFSSIMLAIGIRGPCTISIKKWKTRKFKIWGKNPFISPNLWINYIAKNKGKGGVRNSVRAFRNCYFFIFLLKIVQGPRIPIANMVMEKDSQPPTTTQTHFENHSFMTYFASSDPCVIKHLLELGFRVSRRTLAWRSRVTLLRNALSSSDSECRDGH